MSVQMTRVEALVANRFQRKPWARSPPTSDDDGEKTSSDEETPNAFY